MIENDYAAILQHDTIKIKHPSKKGEVAVDLYRIIATKSFKLYNSKGEVIATVNKYDIGGFVESIDNLDPDNPVWIDHSARVFDSAKLLAGSYMRNNALLYENATAIHSELAGHCRIHGSAIVENSQILDLVEVKDRSCVKDSLLKNNVKIYEDANVINSYLYTAATAHGKCTITDSDIGDISEIRGDSIINKCKYSGRVIRESGEYNNEVLDKDIRLKVYEEVDEDFHKTYHV